MKQPDICLTLVCAHELAETVIDVLLEHEDIVHRFGSYPIAAHGARIGYANIAEQVRGSSRRTEFQLLMERQDTDALLAALRQHLPRAEITYWALPLLAYGRI
jgi:hypothetical protein